MHRSILCLMLPVLVLSIGAGCQQAEVYRPREQASTPVQNPSVPIPQADSSRVAPSASSALAPPQRPSILPTSDCLVNEFGIRRKVLVIERGVRCRAGTPDGPLVEPPLKFFWPYFTHAVQGEGINASYLIGDTPRKDSIRGWVSGAAVVPWPTRVGADYDPQSRIPLLIYPNKEALIELIKNGTTTTEPLARALPTAPQRWMPWPIAESYLLDHNGRSYELVRLLFLGSYRQGSDLNQSERAGLREMRPSYSDEEVAHFRRDLMQIRIVFVVDNTASTTPFVPLIVQAVEQIARRLKESRLRPDVSFGLVLYRDYVPAILFPQPKGPGSVVKVFPFERNLEAFLQAVRPLEAAAESSGELPEAVYDGVNAALSKMQWGEGQLSNRVLVLIGDNSAHEPGHPKNPQRISAEQLIAEARQKGIRVFGLCVQGQGNAAERQRHQRQWETLAQGTRGASYPLDQAERVAKQIEDILGNRLREVRARENYLEARRAGKGDKQVPLDEQERCAVVEFLRQANIDPDRLGPNTPRFASGWCMTEMRGRPLLRKKVFLARPELDLLMSELNTLNSLLNSPQGVRRALQLAAGTRVDPASFFARPAEETPSETMDLFLMKKGIPCQQGLLKLTRAEIEHMPEERRAALRERIGKSVLPALLNACNDDRVFTWLNDLEFGWLSDELFP